MNELTKLSLRCLTYNCKNCKSSINELSNMCDNYDIICLQEHWLFNDELIILKNIHKEFDAIGASSMTHQQLYSQVGPLVE